MNAAERTNGELLIVEDDRDFVDDLFTMWRPPLPVARAATGKEAFDYLQNGVPSLVLLDLNLPHYIADDDASEGFGILSYIRSSVSSDVHVIVITRERSEATRSRAVSLGANDFFPKSLDIADLDEAVSTAMREWRSSAS